MTVGKGQSRKVSITAPGSGRVSLLAWQRFKDLEAYERVWGVEGL